MSSTVTVTAPTGPGVDNTATVISDVTAFLVDISRGVLQIFKGSVLSYPFKEFDITDISTFTVTVSGGVYTVTIS